MKKFCFLLIFSSIIFFSQTPLKGQAILSPVAIKVVDNNNEPLAGAEVVIKDVPVGTITNSQGIAVLVCQSTVIIVISAVGFVQAEVPRNGLSEFIVVLSPSYEAYYKHKSDEKKYFIIPYLLCDLKSGKGHFGDRIGYNKI